MVAARMRRYVPAARKFLYTSVMSPKNFTKHGFILGVRNKRVSGVGCQEDTEDRTQKTACDELRRVYDSRQKADCFLPSVICLLTPDT